MKGVITSLHSYPLKSASGLDLPSAEIRPTGFLWDRHWMLVNEQNKFVSQRRVSKMALLSASVVGDLLTIEYPGREKITIPIDPPADAPRYSVTMHRADAPIEVVDLGDVVSEWFTEALNPYLKGTRLRLVSLAPNVTRRIPDEPDSNTSQVDLADGYPYLVTSQASLNHLNDLLDRDEPLEMIRFRPNIVIDLAEPWSEMQEDLFLCTETRSISFRLAKPCQRCGIPQVNPTTGLPDIDSKLHKSLKSLCSEFRKPSNCFGQNAIPEKGIGETLKVGMPIEVIPASEL